MTNAAWIARQTETPEARRDYERERLAVWTLDHIAALMQDQGITKADIARALGTSRAHISQLFGGEGNITLRTLADLAFACGSRVVVTTEPLCAGEFIPSPVALFEAPTRPTVVAVEDVGPSPASEANNNYALAA